MISLYKNTLGILFPPSCRFQPSCTNYMIDSINKYGAVQGTVKGIKRILRCNPFSKQCGWDPVD